MEWKGSQRVVALKQFLFVLACCLAAFGVAWVIGMLVEKH